MKFFSRLHDRLGDFWWYSLMIFTASRAADLLNAFVGLWLVPRYVPPSELGAVLPITNYATFLAFPMAVFVSTFRNEISGLAIRKEFGKLKTLMRGVFIASGVFLFCAVVVSYFLLPHFLERIRIVEGSLGLLILMTSFVGAVAPVYSNAMQALKKFRATSFMNLVGAPIRLLTMLIAMPFRPLAGYFVGQMSTPVFNIVMSIFSLRKELSVKAEPYWTSDVVKRFGRLFLIFAIGGVAGSFSGLVETTVLRQRLPELDSAAYYVVTRFSDISGFLYCTLVFTIFPFTADLAAAGRDVRPLMLKASTAIVAFSLLVAGFFGVFGKEIISLLPHGDLYARYWWAIPWMVGITTMGSIVGIYTTAEVSANRFGYLWWMVPLNLIYPAVLLMVTGYGYFKDILPPSVMEYVMKFNATSLSSMLWWMTAIGVLRLVGIAIDCARKR
jgi:O-antigen/teichoic acid export membrane protein